MELLSSMVVACSGRGLCLFLLCLYVVYAPLTAIITESSASASSLSGITMLSTSPADYILSPIVGATGVCTSWQIPYGISSATTYGLHTAFPLHPFIVASGISYLNHPDYRWQDEYLAAGVHFKGFRLGATQHLLYEKIARESWLTWDNDFAIALESDVYGTELRYNSCRTRDAAVILSASSKVNKSTTICSAYTWRKHDADTYAIASNYQVARPLIINCSWQSDPARFGIGMNILMGGISLMYAVRTHTELNLTHNLDLGASW